MNKQELRRQKKEIENRSAADAAIFKSVTALSSFHQAQMIFIYLSTDNEPSTDDIIMKALELGKAVCVPVCHKPPVMTAHRIESLNDLVINRYGIREPDNSTPVVSPDTIDLAIIPCVKASSDGKRLGHGGGYYDYYLKNTCCLKICLCYKENITEDIETEPHDILMDYVITQDTIFKAQ